MKKKKYILVFVTILLFVLLYAKSTGFDWKYFCAGIIYSGQSTMNSEILFSKASGFYDDEFYLRMTVSIDHEFI